MRDSNGRRYIPLMWIFPAFYGCEEYYYHLNIIVQMIILNKQAVYLSKHPLVPVYRICFLILFAQLGFPPITRNEGFSVLFAI